MEDIEIEIEASRRQRDSGGHIQRRGGDREAVEDIEIEIEASRRQRDSGGHIQR